MREDGKLAGAGGGSGAAAEAAAAGPVRMGLGELARVGLDIARALAFAHSKGVTHNDVKSQNVLFTAGGHCWREGEGEGGRGRGGERAVLADFGLAKRVRSALPNTMAALLGSSSGGGMLGTVTHCAPENFDDESPHYGQPPGDIFSLGVLLYEMGTGLSPWAGRSMMVIMRAVEAGTRPALPADVHAGVRALVTSCWAQDPAARPTAAALVAELAALHAGEGGEIKPPPRAAPKQEILCLGDSITFEGWGDGGSTGWLALLQAAYLHRASVINSGYAGYTTRTLGPIAESILTSRPQREPYLAVTVFLGANDASQGEQHVPVEEYRSRLGAMLAAAAQVARLVVCIGPGPVDSGRWRTRSNAAVAAYNDAALAACASARCACPATPIRFVSLLAEATGTPSGPHHARIAEGASAPWAGLLRDGLHLSSAGNALLARLVLGVLQAAPGAELQLQGPLGAGSSDPAAAAAPTPAHAEFLGADTSTKGNWPSACGRDGHLLANGPASLPQYATVRLEGQSSYTWGTPMEDQRALLMPASPTRARLAAAWYSETAFTVEVVIAGGAARRVGAYMVDWDGASFWHHAREHRIDVEDAATGAVLCSHEVSAAGGYEGGLHLAWLVRGAVRLRFTNAAGSINAMLGGLFFGGPLE